LEEPWPSGLVCEAGGAALLPVLRGFLALPLRFLLVLVLVLVLAFIFTPLSGRNSTPAASRARCTACWKRSSDGAY